MSGSGRCYVGRAMALHSAGVGHLPELATRHHPAEMKAVVAEWLASDRDVVAFNPYALDAIPLDKANRILCVATRVVDGKRETLVRRLVDHPLWTARDVWVSNLRPGECWANTGEDWIFDLPQ